MAACLHARLRCRCGGASCLWPSSRAFAATWATTASSVSATHSIDLVVATGVAGTDPAEHPIPRVPCQVGFSPEASRKIIETLASFYQLAQAECAVIGHERGARFEFDRRLRGEAATMDERPCSLLADACAAEGTPYDVISS